jgi:AcrR family transcriptional regulator
MTATASLDTDDDVVLGRILDAAADLFLRYGVRRTTMDDVARAARVGRNTVFRRVGSKEELVRAVAVRELRRILVQLDQVVVAAASPLDRLVGVFATTVRAMRAHPMMGGAAAERPDEFAELSVLEAGNLMELSTAYLVGVLRADQERGELPADVDIESLAELVVRLVHSVFLVPSLARPLESDAELRAFAADVLRPHLGR